MEIFILTYSSQLNFLFILLTLAGIVGIITGIVKKNKKAIIMGVILFIIFGFAYYILREALDPSNV